MNYYCVHSKGNFINQPNMRVLLLLLFCSVLCAHAQVSSRSDEMSESSFISYRLEGEPAHRLFLHKDTMRVEVKGIGLSPHYTLSYVIAQDGCLQRVGTPNARQTVKKGIDMDLSISASLDGKCLKHILDNEIRISGNNRPYFREQAVKMYYMEWICCGFMTVRLYGTPPNLGGCIKQSRITCKMYG